jgi:hypothetical protein
MDNISQMEDFDSLIKAFINIGNRIEHEKITKSNESLYNAEGLGKKILHHIITSRFLINGYQLNGFYPQVDFASIAVLTRAALETYLTLNYLFVTPKDSDEKEFKLQVWYLGGLDRIKFERAFADNMKKWEEECQQAERLRSKIEATNFYKKLHLINQEKVLKGDWKFGGWSQLATAAGFDEKYFRQIYSWLCAYAHSNRWSIIQIQQMSSLNEQQEMGAAFISILMITLGKYGHDYIEIMPGLKDKVDRNSKEYQIISEYKTIAETLKCDLE